MKIEKHQESRERKILSAMIVNDTVCGRITSKWDGKLFESSYANTVGEWCVEHYKKFQEAPGKSVVSYYESWSEQKQDKDTSLMVGKFLQAVSDEYESSKEDVKPDHILDVAGVYFNQVRYTRLADNITNSVKAGKIEKADSYFSSFNRVEMGAGAGVSPFTDKEIVRSVFNQEVQKPIVEYPGALGRFFYNSLVKDSFVCFWGAQKSGKSFWLLDIAYRAVTQRKKVAYFQVGDMSEDQFMERMLSRVARHPMQSDDGKWPYSMRYPTDIMRGKEVDLPVVKYKTKAYQKPLNEKLAWKACEDLMRLKVRSKKPYFMLSTHLNLSVNVLGIKSILETWAMQDWVPDCIIIDYADNLGPVDKSEDKRDQINTTWNYLRVLSHSCLLVTASQISARAFDKLWLDRDSFSEDNRKLNHVTMMVGINCRSQEKSLGVVRLNCIVKRRGKFRYDTGPSVAQCLSIAHPSVRSVW